MPYNYDGDENATEAPSAAPGPGVVPTASAPADSDPRNADSVRQMAKVSADFTAYIQKSVRLDNPQTPSTTAGIGRMFTNVAHSGAGTGTVKPTGGIACYGYRYVFLITLAGAVGVAKFKVSTDGGKTYGAEQTTAASYTDGSGVTVDFVGTFVLDDTYKFRGTDTPLAMWHDQSGHAREVIDHSGFLNGQVTTFREDWAIEPTTAFAAGSTGVLYPGHNRWKYTLGNASTADPTMALQVPNSDMLGNFNTVLVTGGDDAPTVNGMATSRPVCRVGGSSTACAWMQALVREPVGGTQAVDIGFSGGTVAGLGASNSDHVCFGHASGANWFARVADAVGSATSVDTGIAPNTGAAADWQLLRIELYGASTPLGVALGGAVLRFLIDGVQVAIFVNDARTPDGTLCVAWGQFDPGASPTANQLEMGPITYGVNWLDDPVRM